MSVSLPHAWAVWQRNATMYRRIWPYSLLPNFFEPVFYLTAIGIGVGAYVSDMAGMSYIEFLAPGLVCVAAMNGASFEVTYNTYVRLKIQRTYDVMLTAPIESDDVLLGEMLWTMTRVLLYGGVFYLMTIPFGLAPMPWSLLALPILMLAGYLFATIGLAFTLRIEAIDLFSIYFTLFLTPLFLFSDVFFPINERLSGGWLLLAEALPLLHPVRLARLAYAGTWHPIALWDLAYIGVVSGVLTALCRVELRRRLTN